jgi:hypothetical protein
MRRWFWLGATGVVVAAMVAAAAWGRDPSVSQADCTVARATQLVNQNKLNNFLLAQPVAQVLCGAFTGAGSEAMAVTIKAPTCWSPQGWAVFRFTNGTWQLVMVQRLVFVVAPLVAVGSDIRETQPVFRPGDPRCIPSGGTRARLWHWDGSALVAGAWKQVTGPAARKNAFVNSPPAIGAQCGMSDDPSVRAAYAVEVRCQSVRTRARLFQTARMRGNGVVVICRDRGTRNKCNIGNSGEDRVPTLAYGKRIVVGRFSCRSLRSGIRCTVTLSGKGFLINSTQASRVGR